MQRRQPESNAAAARGQSDKFGAAQGGRGAARGGCGAARGRAQLEPGGRRRSSGGAGARLGLRKNKVFYFLRYLGFF
jgi:hypothetical protein